MAQIGSYVPAQSMRLKPLDGVLTRMGGTTHFVPIDGYDMTTTSSL